MNIECPNCKDGSEGSDIKAVNKLFYVYFSILNPKVLMVECSDCEKCYSVYDLAILDVSG